MNDLDAAKNVIPIVAACISCLGACISFVNSRLTEAKTPEKKKAVLKNVAITADTLLHLIGCILVVSKTFIGAGYLILIVSFLSGLALFLGVRWDHLRLAVADLVFRGFVVVLIIFSSLAIQIVGIQKEMVKFMVNTNAPAIPQGEPTKEEAKPTK